MMAESQSRRNLVRAGRDRIGSGKTTLALELAMMVTRNTKGDKRNAAIDSK
jgi:hypothetical protein